MNKSAEILQILLFFLIVLLIIVALTASIIIAISSFWLGLLVLVASAVFICFQFIFADALLQGLIDIAETKIMTKQLLKGKTIDMGDTQDHAADHQQDTSVQPSTDMAELAPAIIEDSDYDRALNDMLSNGTITQDVYNECKEQLLSLNNKLSIRYISEASYTKRVAEMFNSLQK